MKDTKKEVAQLQALQDLEDEEAASAKELFTVYQTLRELIVGFGVEELMTEVRKKILSIDGAMELLMKAERAWDMLDEGKKRGVREERKAVMGNVVLNLKKTGEGMEELTQKANVESIQKKLKQLIKEMQKPAHERSVRPGFRALIAIDWTKNEAKIADLFLAYRKARALVQDYGIMHPALIGVLKLLEELISNSPLGEVFKSKYLKIQKTIDLQQLKNDEIDVGGVQTYYDGMKEIMSDERTASISDGDLKWEIRRSVSTIKDLFADINNQLWGV